MAYIINGGAMTSTQDLTIPQGVYSLKIICYGGGAGGSSGPTTVTQSGGGGGGGACAIRAAIRVIPGKTYTFTVGAAVNVDTNGNFTQFIGEDLTCKADAGLTVAGSLTGGAGGTVANSIGDAGSIFAGGAGATQAAVAGRGGGGGGGVANTLSAGGNGFATVTAVGGNGGAGGGGKGGNFNSPGAGGTAIGCGGGGAGGNNNGGGRGVGGMILCYFNIIPYTSYTGAGYAGGMAF
jgi:hypothetical protein